MQSGNSTDTSKLNHERNCNDNIKTRVNEKEVVIK